MTPARLKSGLALPLVCIIFSMAKPSTSVLRTLLTDLPLACITYCSFDGTLVGQLAGTVAVIERLNDLTLSQQANVALEHCQTV